MKRLRALPAKEKFQHDWLNDPNISCCQSTGMWWLVYVEGKGMFCTLCRKHDAENSQNKKKIFNTEPSTRFRPATLREHIQTDETGKRQQHGSAIQKEHLQRTSCFEAEIHRDKFHGDEGIVKAFSAFYFVAKQEIANANINPLLELLERVGASEVETFKHRSKGSIQEIFNTISLTLRDEIIADLQDATCFGILCDDVCDVATTEQMVTFVQYVKNGKCQVKFLTINNLLENSPSANAETMVSVLSVVSDGASVMVGKTGGFAAKLRNLCGTEMGNIHSICHRLALACTDTLKDPVAAGRVNKMHLNLLQLWKYFENSPKRTSAYLKVQLNFKKIVLPEGGKRVVATKLHKACQTRWLSFDRAVSAAHKDLVCILFTLSELSDDAAADGFLKKIKDPVWIGTLYILNEVLPLLSELSKTFQRGTVNFNTIAPMVAVTSQRLASLPRKGSAIQDLQNDFKEGGRLYILTDSSEFSIQLTDHHIQSVKNVQEKYIKALIQNIEQRFAKAVPVIGAFDIFNPLSLSDETSVDFVEYGQNHINTLAKHFYQSKSEDEICISTRRLAAEFQLLKYHLGVLKKELPYSMHTRSTEWCLEKLLSNPSYSTMMPLLMFLAEVALSMPVSNAWPERGASAVKRIKTRLRSSLGQTMLDSLMNLSINGLAVNSPRAAELMKASSSVWRKKEK